MISASRRIQMAFRARRIPFTRLMGRLAKHWLLRDAGRAVLDVRPPTLAVLGTQGSGRSTLLNALLASERVAYGENSSTRTWNSIAPSLDPGLLVRDFCWRSYVALADAPGAGALDVDAPALWATSALDAVVLVLHPSHEGGRTEADACRAVADLQRGGVPVAAVLNAIDVRQRRHAQDLASDVERHRKRIARDFGLQLDSVVGVSARSALVAQLVLAHRGPTPADLREELDRCWSIGDPAAPVAAARALLARSGITEASEAIDGLARRHLLQPWARRVLKSIDWEEHDDEDRSN